MTAKQLKNSILQLAVQGKLVEQDENDEPASVLIERIKAEKEQLIKDKKNKKDKPLAPITDEEKPFKIPSSWEWVRLGEVGNWGSGATPSRTNPLFYNGDIPWLKTGDLTDGYILDIPEYITDLALEKTSVRLNPKDAVLIAMYGATIGKLGILTFPATTNQACCACITYNGLYNKYLFYYLMSKKEDFSNISEGGAQPNISKEKIINTLIPLPPLAEQKKIVEKIEELMTFVNDYDKAYTELEKLNKEFPEKIKKSVLQYAVQGKLVKQEEMDEKVSILLERIKTEKEQLIKDMKIKKDKPLPPITDEEKPFKIPSSWEWVRLGEVGNWGSGATPSRTNPLFYNGDIPWLKTGDLTDGYIFEIPEYITDLALEKTSVRLNPKDAVLIAMYGATIGKLGILTFPATTNQACCACITYNGLYNKYLFYYLMSKKEDFSNISEGGAQPNISKEKIINTLIPLPPLAEQKRIVEKIEEVTNLIAKI